MKFKCRTIALMVTGLVCLLVYLPALSCGFVNLDDFDFVVNNPVIRNLNMQLLKWAFSTPRDLWIPLTWISFAFDYQVWQLNPFGYHLTNILLHTVNAMLFILLLDQLLFVTHPVERDGFYNRNCYTCLLIFGGLLFGIHPLRTESVVWVTERKDVLNGLFTISSMFFYLAYVGANVPEQNKSRSARMYVLSYILSCLSLMAKPVSIFLPILFLIVDWYPLNRYSKASVSKLLLEKLPFLITSAAVTLLTLKSSTQKDLLVTYDIFPLAERIIVTGYALFEYVRLTIIPIGIAPYHEIPNPIPLSANLKALLAFAGIGYSIFSFRTRRYLTVLCLAFVLPLIPVLPILQNGAQAFAARYTYLPSLFVCAAITFWLFDYFSCSSSIPSIHHISRTITTTFAYCLMLLLAYGYLTERLIPVWYDSNSLWSRVIQIQPVGRAYKERALIKLSTSHYESAIQDLNKALELDEVTGAPYLHNYHALKGAAYSQLGKFSSSVDCFTKAIDLHPLNSYFYHRGLALMAQGLIEEAKSDIRKSEGDTSPISWIE